MHITRRLDIRELEANDIRSVLGRNSVGRLAFCLDGEVDIRPLHYVFARGMIYGRTGSDARFLTVGEHRARVAFEVDEVESVFHWTSVVAHGRFDVLDAEAEEEEWRNAVELLRRVIRETFMDDDPLPERDVIVRIAVQEATGRSGRDRRAPDLKPRDSSAAAR